MDSYHAEDNLSKSEYVLRLYNELQGLSEAPSDASIVQRLSRHFDKFEQQSVISRGVNTINELTNMLDSLDQSGN